jgi:hypothetical protein
MSGRRQHSSVLQCSTFVLACIALACGGGGDATCTRDDDCASHFCRADGTCGPAEVDAATGDVPDAPSSLCMPNADGTIVLAELPHTAGRSATFRVAANGTFNTAGTPDPMNMRRWDLSAQQSGDADRTLALISPAGTWWQAKFPAATYAALLAINSELLGVFAVDANGITLLGVVSPDAGVSRTELAYDPPARILALPLTTSSQWTTTSTVSGTALGVITAYTEKYQSRVDQIGTMKTPYGEFPVQRVATDLTRTQGLATILTKRSFAWIAECFGSIANVSSQDFETAAEFADPAEIRRLAP